MHALPRRPARSARVHCREPHGLAARAGPERSAARPATRVTFQPLSAAFGLRQRRRGYACLPRDLDRERNTHWHQSICLGDNLGRQLFARQRAFQAPDKRRGLPICCLVARLAVSNSPGLRPEERSDAAAAPSGSSRSSAMPATRTSCSPSATVTALSRSRSCGVRTSP